MGYIVNPPPAPGGNFIPLAGTPSNLPLTGTINTSNGVTVIRPNNDLQAGFINVYEGTFNENTRLQFSTNQFTLRAANSFVIGNNNFLILTANPPIQITSSTRVNISMGSNGIEINTNEAHLVNSPSISVLKNVFSWGRTNNLPVEEALSFFGAPIHRKQTVPNVPSGNVSHTEFNNLLQVLRNYGLIG